MPLQVQFLLLRLSSSKFLPRKICHFSKKFVQKHCRDHHAHSCPAVARDQCVLSEEYLNVGCRRQDNPLWKLFKSGNGADLYIFFQEYNLKASENVGISTAPSPLVQSSNNYKYWFYFFLPFVQTQTKKAKKIKKNKKKLQKINKQQSKCTQVLLSFKY